MSTIAELQAYIYEWANRKGWWEPQCAHEGGYMFGSTIWCKDCGAVKIADKWLLPAAMVTRNIGELHALFHTEISESFEEIRNHHPVTEIYYNTDLPQKPEGVPIELADLVIRILDFCGHFGINLEEAINIKMAYNETRPYRHGGKSA